MKLKSACLLGLILFFTCKIITLAQLSEFSSEEFRAIDEITTEKPPAQPTNITIGINRINTFCIVISPYYFVYYLNVLQIACPYWLVWFGLVVWASRSWGTPA